MNKARLASHYERLGLFEGVWEGEESLAPSPWAPAGTARGKVAYHRAVDGIVLVQDYVQEHGGRPAFTGHGVFTVDPSDGITL